MVLSLNDAETDPPAGQVAVRLLEIGAHCAALPDIDPRSADEIVDYDEIGLWR